MEILESSQLDTENPQPGIYRDVKDSKYFETDAINNSALSTIIDKTPAHYRYEKENPSYSSSDSQLLGSACHATLLQPDRMEEDIRVIPSISKRKNAFFFALDDMFPDAGITKDHTWGQSQELIEEYYPDVILCDEKHVNQAEAMINKLQYDDKEVGGWKLHTVLNEGHVETEVVFIWVDEKTGITCKAKFDAFNFTIGIGFDYKTARDASPQKFRYSVSDYGYHRQLCHYYRGAKANDANLHKNAILAQESEPPYPHAWYEFIFEARMAAKATGEEWAIANYQLDYGLKKLAWCREHDKWPGYTYHDGSNVFPIVLKYDDYRDFRDNPFTGNEEDDELNELFGSVEDVNEPEPKIKSN